MVCTPDVAELETRRPIPVSCTTGEPAARVTVYYKEFGAKSWGQANMGKSGDSWLAQIQCSSTGISGTFNWYAVAVSGQGRPIDSYGSEQAPQQIEIVETTAEAPPAHPGKEAPERCADLAECPEDMRGTPACPDTGGAAAASGGGGWGDSCEDNSACQSDLACIDGTCQSPPSCETDADCTGGSCVEFLCQYGDGGSSSSPSGPGPKNLVGLQIGFDLAQMSATGGVGNPLTGSKYTCYLDDAPYAVPNFRYTDPATGSNVQTTTPSRHHHPEGIDETTGQPGYDALQSGSIPSALALSTIRVMATYERMLSENFGAEGRLGVAFNGKPDSGFVDLLHLEARAKYWFSGNGPGFRLFGLLGAGLGQVDAQKKIFVNEFDVDHSPTYHEKCASPGLCSLEVTAYKSLGKVFITGGVGAFWNLGGHGPSAEANVRIMLPESGFVIQPTLGYLVGF
jgi:hypothetical protein